MECIFSNLPSAPHTDPSTPTDTDRHTDTEIYEYYVQMDTYISSLIPESEECWCSSLATTFEAVSF